ncbi:synaptotagmin-16-like [Dendronephthya gigantea]|uniref:synaptotagmin-16-like n=1 Tax=Dendronephthya gigantea TaxID=151771 RepID=UPI00106A9096|nr:synaptotagmin-16-like [Dendronephthya gigantea]
MAIANAMANYASFFSACCCVLGPRSRGQRTTVDSPNDETLVTVEEKNCDDDKVSKSNAENDSNLEVFELERVEGKPIRKVGVSGEGFAEMNSTERSSSRNYPPPSYNNATARRFTEPYRSKTSNSAHTNTYRSLSDVSQGRYFRPSRDVAREAMEDRRRNVSPDLSLSSNFEAMNINGSISPASSTYTLSSQIASSDFDFTVAKLRFVLDYTFHRSKLTTTISKVELTNEGIVRDKESMEIDLVLLPDKRQTYRIKTKNFTEPYAFYIYPRERLPQMRLRFRLYEGGRMLKRVLLAEGVFALKNVRLGFELITLDIELFPPTRGLAYGNRLEERSLSPVSMSTDISSRLSTTEDAELLVSLQHRSTVQRLNIEILKTRCCGPLVHNKATPMYVEIKLISSSGDLLFDTKTSIQKDSPNPEFNEKFSFFLPDNNLLSVTLLVTLLRVSRPFGRKSLVGRFSIGRNNSDKSEEMHWNEIVRAGQGSSPILKWHKLFQL